MKSYRLALSALLIATLTAALFTAAAFAQTATASAPAITLNNQEQWTAGTGAFSGVQVAVLAGDPSKPGEFTVRLKIPAGTTLPPHFHSNAENVTVISGTLLVGIGDKMQPDQMKALPAGSFVMVPAQLHHYAATKEPTVVQISGVGPLDMNSVKMTR